jgi:DNA-directed RNA polymerase specialized sigma24 family protein
MEATTERQADSDGSESEPVPVDSKRSGLPQLYLDTMPDAIGLAYLLSGDLAVAERIADAAFVRATGRFEHLTGKGKFPAWLRRHVIAVFLNRERRHGPSTGNSPGPDRPQDGDSVWPALRSLPPRERAAVVLLYCRGLSEEEVARALGCSVSAARTATVQGVEMLHSMTDGTPAGRTAGDAG